MGSIRSQITLVAAVAVAIVAAGIWAIAYFSMDSILRNATLDVLSADLAEAAEEAEEGDYRHAVDNVDSSLVQIVAANGEVLACSPRLRNLSSLADVVTVNEKYDISDLAAFGAGDSPWLLEGAPYLMAERIVDFEDETVTIVALTSIRSGEETIRGTMMLLAVVLAVFVVLVALAAWLLAARTLRPVERMCLEAESIGAAKLDARLEVPVKDKDLKRLATTFNDLLARVEASVNEQKQFVSDASHELKSPLSATALILETLREHPDSIDLQQALEDMGRENARMTSIVGDMLVLARYDENRMKLDVVPVDVMDVVGAQARQAALRVTDVEADFSGLEPVVCSADPELLGHAVRNLVENALRYARSRIAVSCSQADGRILVYVDDDGPGVPAADRERIFGRFVRLEDSRSRKQGSTGLGLAVVMSVASVHGGTARFEDSPLGGARAVLEIPA